LKYASCVIEITDVKVEGEKVTLHGTKYSREEKKTKAYL